MTPTDRRLRPGRWLGVSVRRQVQRFAVAGFAFLVVLSGVVVIGAANGVDRELVAGVRRQWKWVDPVGLWVELPGLRSFVYPAMIVFVLIVSLRRRDLRPLLATLVTFALVNLVVGGIKIVTGRPTPRIGGPETFAERMSGLVGAFPSGHAANIGAVAVLLTILGLRYASRRATVVATVLGASATLAVGVTSWLRDTHWVTDLLAGIVAGGALAALGCLIVDRIGPLWPRSVRVPAPVAWAGTSAALGVLAIGWVLDTTWSADHLGWLSLGIVTGVVGWLLSDFRAERRARREVAAQLRGLDVEAQAAARPASS